MPNEDEKIRLTLDLGESAKNTQALTEKLDLLKTAAENVGGKAFGDLVGRTTDVVKSFGTIGQAAEDSAAKLKPSWGDIAGAGKELFDALSEGNVGPAITGVSELVALIPGLNTFAPAIRGIGTASAAAFPVIKEWVAQMQATGPALDKALAKVDQYGKAVEKVTTELEKWKALEDAKAKDAAKETPGDKQKARGETIEQLLKGNEADALKDVREGVFQDHEQEREEQVDSIMATFEADMKKLKERAKDMFKEEREDFLRRATERRDANLAKVGSGEQKEAEDLLAKARTGDAAANARLDDILPLGTTREIFKLGSPQAQDEARAGKRDVADQEQRFKQRQEQDKARAAANDQVQARIKQDIAAQNARAIEGSESAARGQAVKDADKEAVKKFFEDGDSIRGAGQERPGSANGARQETIFNRLHDTAQKKASRRRPTNHGKRPGRSPSPEQERSGPTAMQVGMEQGALLKLSMEDMASQRAAYVSMMQQLRMMQGQNRSGIQTDRSAASTGVG